MTEYVRLLLFKGNPSSYRILLQQLTSGLRVTPGGRVENNEDPIDCLVRELKEEHHLPADDARSLRNYGLLYGARIFTNRWQRPQSQEFSLDHCFVIPYYAHFASLDNLSDREIRSASWERVITLIANPSPDIPANIQLEILHAYSLLPLVLRDWNITDGRIPTLPRTRIAT